MIDSIWELLSRLRAFFHKREEGEDFDAELAAHLDLAIQDNLRQGMSPAEARRCALISLGGLEQTRELQSERRGLPALDAVLRDFRHGFRRLRHDAALSTFAILIVGLGVGAGSTVFNLCNALFLRPLPFEEPGRLVWIANGTSANLSAQTVQAGNLLDFRAQSQSFSEVAAFSPFYGTGDIRLSGTGEAERLTGVPVSENFFRLLGVQPEAGRFFTAEECAWNAPKSVVLTHDVWQRRFAADRKIIGRPITLDNAPVTVVGVLPASFDFAGMFAPGSRIDLFLPFPLSPETDRNGNTLALIGRLRPGASLQSAQVEASLIGERIGGALRERRRNAFQPRLSPLREHVSGGLRHALFVVAGAVGFLMLLVCANLSNLLLARAAVRQKEMAVRAALGAGRWRLIQQMLLESVTLSGCGAALGLALSYGGTRLLSHIEGTSLPLLRNVRVDGAALGFTLAVAVLTGILFGLVPALQASAASPHQALKETGRGSCVGRERAWVRGSVVVCEITLACVLLTGAGLLMHSLIRVLDVDLGFETANVIALRIDPGKSYTSVAAKNAYFDEVLRTARTVPGVEAAGVTDALPLGQNYGWRLWSLQAKGQVYESGRSPLALVRLVDDGYLDTMRIALRAGRSFTPADNASTEPVTVINEALARTLWPGQDPLGRIVKTSGIERRVVGLVREVRYFGLEQESGAEIYLPIRQTGDFRSADLVIRTSGSLLEVMPRVRAALRSVDPSIPAAEFRTMQQLVDRSVFARRFVVLLVGGFALFALILALLGIYAVISYSVSQRSRELGIRMALGASARDLQAGILMQAGRLALVGMVLGIAASWVAARALQGLLFGVKFSDPATFAGVFGILATVAMLAGYLPARRASRLNPADVLRSE